MKPNLVLVFWECFACLAGSLDDKKEFYDSLHCHLTILFFQAVESEACKFNKVVSLISLWHVSGKWTYHWSVVVSWEIFKLAYDNKQNGVSFFHITTPQILVVIVEYNSQNSWAGIQGWLQTSQSHPISS